MIKGYLPFIVLAVFFFIVQSRFRKKTKENLQKLRKEKKNLSEDEKCHKEINSKLLKIRKIRRNSWLIFLSFLPATAISFKLADFYSFFRSIPFIWLGSWAYTIYKIQSFKCPSCGLPFHYKEKLSNPWARKCINCKLPLKGIVLVNSESS